MAIIDELVGILGFDFRGENDVKRYKEQLGNVDRQLDNVGKRALNVGRLITGVLVALGTGKAIAGAVSFEEAIADINKVVDATPDQLSALESELLRMSRELPVSAEGLANIAAEAGAAGVALEDLPGFTKQVALAVTAFDLPAQQVGETMSKLANVFGFNVEEMGMFNDTVNHLSNNMAAKAGEVLNFTNRAAGAATLLGLTADQLAGVGAAMIAAGVVPETAARGLNAFATRVQTDAKGVNEALQNIGLSTAEVQRMLAEDGDAALVTIFEELSTLDVSKQAEALKALVGSDFSDDFSKFLANPELLAQGFELANDEAGKLGSAQREFEARAATTAAKWGRIKNIIASVGIILAGPLLDGFKVVADFIFKIVEGIDNAEGAAAKFASVFGALGFDVSEAKIQEWINTIKGGFDELVAFVDPIFTKLSDTFLEIAGSIGEGLSSAFSMIDFDAVKATISDVANAFGTIFDKMLEQGKVNFEVLKAGINRIFDAIDFSGLTAVIGEMDLITNATNIMSAGIDAAGAVFKGVVDFISTAVATLATNLTDFSEGSVLSGFAERIGGIFDKVKAIFDQVSALFASEGGQALLSFLGQLTGELTTLFVELIGNQIITAIDLVVTVIGTLIDVFSKLIEGDFSGALSSLFEGVGEILSIIGESVMSIVNSIDGLFERLLGFSLVDTFNKIKSEFIDFIVGIVQFFKDAANSIRQFFLQVIQDMLNYLVDKINSLNSKLPSFVQFEMLERFSFADEQTTDGTDTTSSASLSGGASVEPVQPSGTTDAQVEALRAALAESGATQAEQDAALTDALNELSALSRPGGEPSMVEVVQEPTPEPPVTPTPVEVVTPAPVVQTAPAAPVTMPPMPPANNNDPIVSDGAAITQLTQIAASLVAITTTLSPIGPALSELATAASTVATMEFAPELVEQTINNDYTKNITNNVTNNTTVNQTVTGNTAPGEAARAAGSAVQRGTDRALTVNNQGADG